MRDPLEEQNRMIIVNQRGELLTEVTNLVNQQQEQRFLTIDQIRAISSYRLKSIKLKRVFRKVKTPEYWSIPAFMYQKLFL